MEVDLCTSLKDYVQHVQVPYLSNEEWQKHFDHIKNLVQHQLRGHKLDEYDQGTSYEDYISSVLYTIRGGEIDYCYHEHQIVDLLRFEKERLHTRWLPQDKYFRVWL